MTGGVLVVGEALVDVVERPDGRTEHPGGGPMNVAVGMARLGERVRLVCTLGDDTRGRAVRSHLEASGVVVDATPIPQTSTAVARIAGTGAASYEFDLDWRPGPVTVPATTALLHVGSIGAVLRPGSDAVLEAVRNRSSSTLLSLDPNVRPSITPDQDVVRAALDPLLDAADVVKTSDEDAAWLWPGLDVDAVLDELLRRDTRLAAVTLGAAGCVVATRGARVRLPAPAVDVADTIGAGDSFMSGLATAVLRTPEALDTADGHVLERVADIALRSAAITVTRVGADPPTSQELSLGPDRR
ncbi:carbohydrate kinase family protein [Curtobacterium sp. 22159]|uniref:carbohydrate kinase family protein n=1 Tax=Curtobacterium sp. 22159 TaxID=3453882 RepID=UPI003F84A413